jgi:hypothetical protein
MHELLALAKAVGTVAYAEPTFQWLDKGARSVSEALRRGGGAPRH